MAVVSALGCWQLLAGPARSLHYVGVGTRGGAVKQQQRRRQRRHQRKRAQPAWLAEHQPSCLPPAVQGSTMASDGGEFIELFVPGRLAMFGEHSDWAGAFRK